MPEGPEIRRAADRVAEALVRRKALHVAFGQERLEARAAELTGRRVQRVEARGKALLISFEGGRHVYSHNQLYGRWYVRPAHEYPETRRSLRFEVHNSIACALLYSASDIAVLGDEEVAAHPYLSRLGPDPLDPSTAPATVAQRALRGEFRGRSLGALLLDQSFVAGIGNYLRSEILFFARVHPAKRPRDLASGALEAIARWAVELPRRSYSTGGITRDLDAAERLRRAGEPRRRYRHAVFGQQGHDCPRCATPIERLSAAGRRIYLCPTCQAAPSGRAASRP